MVLGLQAAGVAALALVTALLLAEAFALVGPVVAVLPLVAVACWYLVLHPGVTLGVLAGSALLFESGDDALWGISTDAWYSYLPGTPFIALDLVLGCLVVAVLIRAVAPAAGQTRLQVRPPGSFTAPLLLLAVATAFGVVNGYFGGGPLPVLVSTTQTLAYLMVVPILVAAVLGDQHERRTAAGVAAAMIVAKAAYALAAYALGAALPFEGSGLTYYEPAMNQASVVYLVAVVLAPFAKVKLPTWVLVGWPLVALSLLLSFRRSFWISALLALVLALVVGSGQRGRPWLFLGAGAVAIALWAALAGGGATAGDNALVGRAQSLSPSEVQQSSNDRYRLDEQRNVIEELRRHPFTGLGIGVPWTARHPLSLEHEGGRQYTHVTQLWYWLKLGPLGLVAYAWLIGAVLYVGLQVWRRSTIPLDRIVALAVAAATAGLVVGETTGAFTGVNFRITVVVAFAIGWLVSAQADLRPRGAGDRPADAEPDAPEGPPLLPEPRSG